MDNEQSKEAIIMVFEEKLDNLTNVVNDIKCMLKQNQEQLNKTMMEIITLQGKIEQQQKEIDELKDKNKSASQWIKGVAASLAVSIIAAVLKIIYKG